MVNLDHVSLVDIDALGEVVATLRHSVMGQLCAALDFALGCDR